MAYVLKTLLFLVFLFFYQQGVANDTYNLEEFRQHHMTNWKPPSKKQQRLTGQPAMSTLENIRIGFVRLDLESDDVFGDGRLEICDDYEVDEQDFNRLNNFYFDYVNMGDLQYRRDRIRRVLRLMHRMFAMNINMINVQSPEKKQLANAKAKSLFEKMFLSARINDRINPYFHYFYPDSTENQSNFLGVNNDLVLMFLAFLGPHFLFQNDLYAYFDVLHNSHAEKSCEQAFDRELLSENINEYDSPQSLANQLKVAELDAGTALLIGLTAMASSAFRHMHLGLEWHETLEALLRRHLPNELLATIYSNIDVHCHPVQSYSIPTVMYTTGGMQEFTHSILGIDLHALSSESPGNGLDYSESLETEFFLEESDSEHQDQSIVIQQQNELIAQLRRELASQTAPGQAGAVGGASVRVKKCAVCHEPLQEMMGFESCEHVGLCQICIERIIREQSGCPFCRFKSESYKRVFDMSFH
ncbi:RING finger protein [Endozoicomonas sp. 8E]|uniref:RING finger protein n=1 Tax=Endozoicomonas sp. 8E TaxID=3035692 RepID=UPI0029391F84|nr:RING finger protein [Endozoicomonas sp. 8E]WOG29218.1 RING finger protein [Endozoicomonas sp. 8E]